MARLRLVLFTLFMCLIIHISQAARNKQPFQYAECRLPYSTGVGKDQVTGRQPTIPNENIWASTFSTDRRMPHLARLDDPMGAWTASVQNSQQYLGVDLGAEYFITKVMTQGRQGSDEFVTEFTLEYSNDNKTWTEYTNEFGVSEVI